MKKLFLLIAIFACFFADAQKSRKARTGTTAAKPQLTIDSVTVNESAGSAVLTVTISNRNGRASSVQFSTYNGTASSGLDFTEQANLIPFNATTDVTKTITVPLLNDSEDEANETLVVKLSDAVNATIINNTGLITIVDDDTTTVDPDPDPELPYFEFAINGGGETVSAGIYDEVTGQKLRTLFEEKWYPAGRHALEIDGKDDAGNIIPSLATKRVEVVSHNLGVTWGGVIGNSSDSSINYSRANPTTGFYGFFAPMAVVELNGHVYYGDGYGEKEATHGRFAISDPQKRVPLKTYNSSSIFTDSEPHGWQVDYATKWNDTVYFTGWQYFANTSFVTAHRPSDAAMVQWSAGATIDNPYIRLSNNVMAAYTTGSQAVHPSGLAVNNTHIFKCEEDMNRITVANKTGAVIGSIPVTKPRQAAWDGTHLWLSYNNGTVEKFLVAANGVSMTTTGIVIPGLSVPDGIAAATIGGIGRILVVDAGVNQQVKRFYTSNGQPDLTFNGTGTFGLPGGNRATPTVSDNTFHFLNTYDISSNRVSGAYLNSDGSWGVADQGNNRFLRFNASNQVTTKVEFQGRILNTTTVDGDSTRVFGIFEGQDILEWKLDYNPNLPVKGQWQLFRNWSASYRASGMRWDGMQPKINPVQFGGSTFMIVDSGSHHKWSVIELNAATGVRWAGKSMPMSGSWFFDKQGNLLHYQGGAYGSPLTITKYAFTGIVSGKPTWAASGTNLLTTPALARDMGRPSYYGHGPFFTEHPTDASKNLAIFYDTEAPFGAQDSGRSRGYRVFASRLGTSSTWQWKAAKAVDSLYRGTYPHSRFEWHGSYPGSSFSAIDRMTFWGHQGEFYRDGQTNMYHLVFDNGLQLKQYGINAPYAQIGYGYGKLAPFAGGNAKSFKVVKSGDSYYLYHGAESALSGIGRVRISNVSSIREQSGTAKLYTAPTPEAAYPTYRNLMSGVTYGKVGETFVSTPVITRIPATDVDDNGGQNDAWLVRKGMYSDRQNDIYLYSRNAVTGVPNPTLTFDLGSNVTSDWKVTGVVQTTFDGDNYNGDGVGYLHEVKDNTGKVYVRFYQFMATLDGYRQKALVNPTATATSVNIGTGTMLYNLPNFDGNMLRKYPQQLIWRVNSNNSITTTYGPYSTTTAFLDPTANWQSPATYTIKLFRAPGNTQGQGIALWDWKFLSSQLPN